MLGSAHTHTRAHTHTHTTVDPLKALDTRWKSGATLKSLRYNVILF